MPAPIVNVTAAAAPTPRSSPTDTGVCGVALITRTGPVRMLTTLDADFSLNDWLSGYGGGSLTNGRLAYSVGYDWVESFFRNGGNKLYTTRVVGPNPVKASLNLTGTGTTLVVTANEFGDLANTKKIDVINGPINGAGFRQIRLLENDGVTVIDKTVEFNVTSTVAGVVLGATSNVPITITLGGGSGLPVVLAATALSGGTDDHANITQTQIDAALTNLFIDLGPMQVAAPDWQTSTAHLSLLSHGATYNRFGLCDPVDTTTKSTVLTNAGLLKGTTNGAYGAMYHPWVTVAALAPGGTGRSVPPSAFAAAKMATTDASDGPAQSPAGQWGVLTFATSINATWSRLPAGSSDADNFADAGVNLIVVDNNQIKLFDILTLAPTDDEFQQIGVARWRMSIVARGKAVGKAIQFSKINRAVISSFESALTGMLTADFNAGALFADLADPRPETAFNVVTTDPVNTTTTINMGQLNAAISARPVKGGRTVNITIAAAPLTQAVA